MQSLKAIIKEELFRKTYSQRDLVSFGNFLLSKQRESSIIHDKNVVYHADLENWSYKENNKENNMKSLVNFVQESLIVEKNHYTENELSDLWDAMSEDKRVALIRNAIGTVKVTRQFELAKNLGMN